MTIQQLIKNSGVKFTRKDGSRLGDRIARRAKVCNVKVTTTIEPVEVNDYPESFVNEMQDIAIVYFSERMRNNG